MTNAERAQEMANRAAFNSWFYDWHTLAIAVCLIALAVVLIWRYRRRVDDAIVSGLAGTLRIGRRYRQRIIDRAQDP